MRGIITIFIAGAVCTTGCKPKTATVTQREELRFEWNEKTTKQLPVKTADRDLDTHYEPAPLNIRAGEINTSDVKARAITDFTLSWEGTPHRIGGMSRDGIDCSGFTVLLYKELFSHQFSARRSADLYTEVEPVHRSNLQTGDLVFFRIYGRKIDHVGVYIGDGLFAHASVRKGVIFSRLSEPYYNQRFFMGGRVKQAITNESSSIE